MRFDVVLPGGSIEASLEVVNGSIKNIPGITTNAEVMVAIIHLYLNPAISEWDCPLAMKTVKAVR